MMNKPEWSIPYCDKGLCKARMPYQPCQGKANGHTLGDGTWCWAGKRGGQCPRVTSNLPYNVKRRKIVSRNFNKITYNSDLMNNVSFYCSNYYN